MHILAFSGTCNLLQYAPQARPDLWRGPRSPRGLPTHEPFYALLAESIAFLHLQKLFPLSSRKKFRLRHIIPTELPVDSGSLP